MFTGIIINIIGPGYLFAEIQHLTSTGIPTDIIFNLTLLVSLY